MVKVAIVCEGQGDRDFFESLLTHLSIDHEKFASFYVFRGKSYIFQATSSKYGELKSLVKAGQIEQILFIVDADDTKSDIKNGGYENTQRALNDPITLFRTQIL